MAEEIPFQLREDLGIPADDLKLDMTPLEAEALRSTVEEAVAEAHRYNADTMSKLLAATLLLAKKLRDQEALQQRWRQEVEDRLDQMCLALEKALSRLENGRSRKKEEEDAA